MVLPDWGHKDLIRRLRLLGSPKKDDSEDHIGHGSSNNSQEYKKDCDKTNPASNGDVTIGFQKTVEVAGKTE
jgi:hypothetical protein